MSDAPSGERERKDLRPGDAISPRARALCALDDLADPGARGFTAELGGRPLELFVVRKGGAVHGYVNRCPHTGVNLEWLADQFLDEDGALIVCATHGALFQIESGYCVAGPCAGDRLRPVPVAVADGNVVLLAGEP